MNISTICSFIYLFSLFLDNTYKWNNWVSMICMVYVWIFKKLTNCFTKWLYHFHSNQQCMNFSCFTSSPILGIITLLNFTHCNCFVMLFHHDFAFPWWLLMLITFHVFVYFLLWSVKILFKFFVSFLIELYTSNLETSLWYMNYKYVPIWGFSFCFL